MPRLRFAAALAAALALLAAGPAAAQQWPTKPIRMIVPWPAGTAGDNNGRAYADGLTPLLGQPVVVDNRGGAGGSIGANAVARAAPDGYTLLVTQMSPLVLRPSLFKDTPLDSFADFVPVSMTSDTIGVVAVSPSLGVKSLKELLAKAKAAPGKVFFGSSGIGSITHVRMEYLKMIAGVEMTHVPYSGSALALPDLLAGNLQVLFDSTVMAQVRAGQLTGLAIADIERDPAVPGMPTMVEALADAGLPTYQLRNWSGAWLPKGTPPEIVEKLSAAIRAVGAAPETQQRLKNVTQRTLTSTPAEMAVVMRTDFDMYAKLVATAGIKAE